MDTWHVSLSVGGAKGTIGLKMARRIPTASLLLRGARFSSRAARPEHLRAYLDVWMGSTAPAPNGRISIRCDGKPLALTVTGRQYLVPTLRLPVDTPPSELQEGVEASASLGASFRKAPIVIDLADWSTAARLNRAQDPMATASKLDACVTAFRERGLHPVGVSNAFTPELQAAALKLGLPCFMGNLTPYAPSSQPMPDSSPPATPETAAPPTKVERNAKSSENVQKKDVGSTSQTTSKANTAEVTARPPHIVQGSVRTGQQVIASEGRSLVVMGNVHSGAEVAADGDIHVYGKLSGRALAGLSGNAKARVFAAKFNAELVAIADCFVTGDQPSDLPNLVVDSTTVVSLDEAKRELTFKSF